MRIFSGVDPSLVGREDVGAPDPELFMIIDVPEMLQNDPPSPPGETLTPSVAYNSVNADQGSADFQWGGAALSHFYTTRPIPPEWRGVNLQLLVMVHHDTVSLTGTGSPPDDQIRFGVGWETRGDLATYVDLGSSNDATAPHEAEVIVQLGTTQEAPNYVVVATIPTGNTDRFLHLRITRDGADADEGLDGNIKTTTFMLQKEPPQ